MGNDIWIPKSPSPMLVAIESAARKRALREVVIETIAIVFLIASAIFLLAGCSPPMHTGGSTAPETAPVESSPASPHDVDFSTVETGYCVTCHVGYDGDDDHPIVGMTCASCHVDATLQPINCTTCHNR